MEIRNDPKITTEMNPRNDPQIHFGVFPKATSGCFPKLPRGVSQSHFGVFPKATSGCFPKLLWDDFRVKALKR